uniref:Ig-like domain-containing protein n=1 Tax=Heterorhabditis bacteriophora TaxID=37862 RepID=A0A1I7W8H7_HETBA
MEMLQPADLLLEKDQRIVEMYLSNIRRFSAGFCIQLDASSTRLMSAEYGEKFTYIQAQSLTPDAENFLNTSFSFAGETRKIVSIAVFLSISFSPSFRSTFSSWRCGSSFVCQHVCHASARIAYEALDANKQLKEYFFGSQYGVITRDKIASHLYQVHITNNEIVCYSWKANGMRQSASRTNSPIKWKVLIAYSAHAVQLVLLDNSIIGFKNECTQLSCNIDYCSSSTILPTNTQQSQFVINLSTLSNVDYKRFVMVSSEMKTYANNEYAQVNLILRPPFRLAHVANNYAVQAILHTVNSNSGFKAFDFVIVNKTTYTVINRKEDYPLSAEEISLMIMECSKYSELDLRYQNEAFPVENITEHDIIELRVAQESNTLVLVLVIVISTILISASMYVGGAVVVKLRTDRLIEQVAEVIEISILILINKRVYFQPINTEKRLDHGITRRAKRMDREYV